jgi:Domain of unknown function (DUF5602)
MNTNQIAVKSFQGRAFQLVMGADRIFLFRELFVALAMILVITGLAFAQSPVNQGGKSNLSVSQPTNLSAGLNDVKDKQIVGETKPLGKGQVRSWVSLDKSGNPTGVGLTFTEEALSTLPTGPLPGEGWTEVSLALPTQASATAFKHIGLNWNPNGHSPAKIYDVAHFDFHFYMITEAERAGITATGDDLLRTKKQPAAEFVPAGYIYVPDSEHARMGAHWVNPLSKELQGQAFSTTFIYGSYNGSLIFAEPMITKSFLETKTNITELIKLPTQYARKAYYPTKYSVRYDPIKKEYTIALEGMTLR